MASITINTKGKLQLETVWGYGPGKGPNGVRLGTEQDEFIIWFDGEDGRERAQTIANLFIEAGLTSAVYDMLKDDDEKASA